MSAGGDMTVRDALVLGAGPAGLTAAMMLARHGRDTLVVDDFTGNHMVNAARVENFPGFPDGIGGADLAAKLQSHAAKAGAQLTAGTVERVEAGGGTLTVTTDAGAHVGRSVVLALGSRLRQLGIDGEDRLRSRGISECATCDGPLFRDRPVAVVGGGDSALDEALALRDMVASVTLIHRGAAPTAQAALRDELAGAPAIRVRAGAEVVGLQGEDALSAVVVRDATGTETVEEVAGLFPFVGLEPNTACVAGLVELDAEGRVACDASLATSVAGIFAAGDIRRDSAAQFASAAGDGATAALAAHRYLG